MSPQSLSSHTLAGVLERLSSREADPTVARRLNEAFAKHERFLRELCRRRLGRASPEQVEEIVQDVLLEAWTQLDHYQPRARFRSWLAQIARYKCSNARQKLSDVLSEDGFLEQQADEPSVLARLAGEQRDELIVEASRNVLEPHDQRLVYLRWVLERSLPDLVDEIEPYEDTNQVRVALQRCKRRLEKEVRRLLDERGLSASFLDGLTR